MLKLFLSVQSFLWTRRLPGWGEEGKGKGVEEEVYTNTRMERVGEGGDEGKAFRGRRVENGKKRREGETK